MPHIPPKCVHIDTNITFLLVETTSGFILILEVFVKNLVMILTLALKELQVLKLSFKIKAYFGQVLFLWFLRFK